MALLQRNVSKISSMLARYHVRSLSIVSQTERDVKKSVFISQSNDVYTNLALENWMYKNFDFSKHHVLLLTKNDPCVVIGNNQNPWVETNVIGFGGTDDKGTPLARRPNDGNVVYNDQGNLNMTFFAPVEHLNSKYNMEIVSRALFREYNMKVNLSPKENLTVYNKAISASGSKLGQTNGYHHCSLLVDVDKSDLVNALSKKEDDTKTTASVTPKKHNFMNVRDVTPKAKISEISSAVGWEFMRTHAYTMKDGGKDLANQQKGFQMVNPTDKWFPGLTEIRENLETWDWCYGKTPKFSISRSFPVPLHLLTNYEGSCPDLCITLQVDHGRINDVTLFVPPGLTSSGFSGEAKVITSLKGHKFSEDAMSSLEWYLGVGENSYSDDRDKFVTECVRQVMTSV